ncbi:hypothetical protein QE152_g1053 [Popillia japonica]|uniref:Ribosomal protein S14 n=1 Tax=Popillia japonica TaxID=7064 RepID=A0AAW1N9G3_POPJA
MWSKGRCNSRAREMMVEEKNERFNGKTKTVATEENYKKWQTTWAQSTCGRWTRRLIPDIGRQLPRKSIQKIKNRHGSVPILRNTNRCEKSLCVPNRETFHSRKYAGKLGNIRRRMAARIGLASLSITKDETNFN